MESNSYLPAFVCLCDILGTDATHAEHIETIKARLYVGVRSDGKFVPGELGMGLVEGECVDFTWICIITLLY